MKTRLWQSFVAVVCCVGITGCTTSRWVTDSRKEVIPDASVTQARPVLDVVQHSQERPELLVKLSKKRTGPIELQEVKHEEVHKVWGISPWKIIGGWFELVLSPVLFVGETLNGTPGRGIGTIISGAMAAVGFNPPIGMGWDLNERDIIGENKTVEVTPLRNSTQTVPWPSGPVVIKIDDMAPGNFQANESGYVEINFKRLPVQLTNRSKALTLIISAQTDGVTVVEHVTVPLSTIKVWERKEAELAKQEQQKIAQQQRELAAQREREAQVAREAAAKQEYEHQHPEIAAAKQAQEAAERQCTDCKSNCGTQALTCATACLGNLKDPMCGLRCQASQEACKGGCEQRRDAQITQAGGTAVGSSTNSGFMQALVAAGDGMAAAKGISQAGTVRTPSPSQAGLVGLTQALSALAGGSASPGGGPVAMTGGQCDDSAEAKEVDALTKRAEVETRGMGIERLQCYVGQQYVQIAQLQVRAATRCKVQVAESQAELQNMQAQARKMCQGIR